MLILLFGEHSFNREGAGSSTSRRDSCQGSFSFPHQTLHSLCALSAGALGPGTTWVQLKGGLVTALSAQLGTAGSHWMHVLICDYAHLFLLCCKRRGKHKTRLIVCIPPGWRLRKACSHTLVPLIPACPGSRGSQGAGGVGAHLCCHLWFRTTHSIDHTPTAWQAIFPNDLAERFPQTLLCWLRCCRVFPQLSSAKEERHQCQC